MRFLIYGAGALGQAIGCMLAVDGHRADLVLRPRFIEALQTDGLEVTGIFGEYRAPARPARPPAGPPRQGWRRL